LAGEQLCRAHSGLIVHPDYRNLGLAKKIKAKVLTILKKKYPNAKVFGITTGLAVMKINSELGYNSSFLRAYN
jgi:ribosomal protein S18 acetylase RimI-like enzyme